MTLFAQRQTLRTMKKLKTQKEKWMMSYGYERIAASEIFELNQTIVSP